VWKRSLTIILAVSVLRRQALGIVARNDRDKLLEKPYLELVDPDVSTVLGTSRSNRLL